jgi:hypothetical protein
MHHDGVWVAFTLARAKYGTFRHILKYRILLRALHNIPFHTINVLLSPLMSPNNIMPCKLFGYSS